MEKNGLPPAERKLADEHTSDDLRKAPVKTAEFDDRNRVMKSAESEEVLQLFIQKEG